MKPESRAGTTWVGEQQFESGSGLLTSSGPLCTLCLVFCMLLPVFLVLNLDILFGAAAEDLGSGPSESD